MSFRWLIGMGLTAVLSVLLVLGAVQFTGSETQAQEPPPDPTECMTGCLLIVDFNGDTVFDVEDVLAFVDGYESQDPAFDYDDDGDVDVFDVLGYASNVRACVLDCVTPAP
jgi:hypothetical protein